MQLMNAVTEEHSLVSEVSVQTWSTESPNPHQSVMLSVHSMTTKRPYRVYLISHIMALHYSIASSLRYISTLRQRGNHDLLFCNNPRTKIISPIKTLDSTNFYQPTTTVFLRSSPIPRPTKTNRSQNSVSRATRLNC